MVERVAVIGGGIVGLATAWREAVRGSEVTLFERHARAEGASVRNFGMVWPIGQPSTLLPVALRSRALWQELLGATGLWHSAAGSVFVARRDDEWQVLSEFAASAAEQGYDCRLLSPHATRELCPAVVAEALLGGMASSTELGVDPREVISRMPQWLAERYGVKLEYETTICEVALPVVRATDRRQWSFDRVTVASGADFATLYPDVFAEHALAKCKLQMMRTCPQPEGWRLGPHVASGLTLRHYASFALCKTLPALKQRIATETPELDEYGIHVMAAQNGHGEVVLGDSHEYGADIAPFDKEEITQLMLRELKQMIDLPTWQLAARWHGIYAIGNEGSLQFVNHPEEGVTIVIATGGCGMTMSFGLAEQRLAQTSAAQVAVAS
jgi:D-hydroxyproline dehydrogenase subunit beta